LKITPQRVFAVRITRSAENSSLQSLASNAAITTEVDPPDNLA
jgi:hypothetical protein